MNGTESKKLKEGIIFVTNKGVRDVGLRFAPSLVLKPRGTLGLRFAPPLVFKAKRDARSPLCSTLGVNVTIKAVRDVGLRFAPSLVLKS